MATANITCCARRLQPRSRQDIHSRRDLRVFLYYVEQPGGPGSCRAPAGADDLTELSPVAFLQDSVVGLTIGTPRLQSSAASSAWKAADRKCCGERSPTGTESTSRPQRRSSASRSRVAPVGHASPVSGSVVKWCGPSTSTARRPPCHSSSASTTRVPSPTAAPACKWPKH